MHAKGRVFLIVNSVAFRDILRHRVVMTVCGAHVRPRSIVQSCVLVCAFCRRSMLVVICAPERVIAYKLPHPQLTKCLRAEEIPSVAKRKQKRVAPIGRIHSLYYFVYFATSPCLAESHPTSLIALGWIGNS